MHKYARLGGGGRALPRKFLEIRSSKIASGAILEQKQNKALHGLRSISSNFWFSTYAFAKPNDFGFPKEKVPYFF